VKSLKDALLVSQFYEGLSSAVGIAYTEEADGHLQALDETIRDRLGGWCACGDREGAIEFVGKTLEIMHLRSEENRGDADTWDARTRELETHLGAAFYPVMYWLDGRGLLEHGTSIDGSRLDKHGQDLLVLIKEWWALRKESNS
jgi:hypothetical protein